MVAMLLSIGAALVIVAFAVAQGIGQVRRTEEARRKASEAEKVPGTENSDAATEEGFMK